MALDRASVPVDSDLRKTENIFFPEDVREIPDEVATEEPLLTKVLASESAMPAVEDA